MELQNIMLKGLRRVYRKMVKPNFPLQPCEYDRTKANQILLNCLNAHEPCMISRLGSGEIGIVCNYLQVHAPQSLWKRCHQYVVDNCGLPFWDKLFFKSMHNNAGIFPETLDTLEHFSERYLQDIPLIDVLGSFHYTEKFMPLRQDVVKVHLECLYPFWAEKPWTLALKGKKVLVIHPFVETIKSQYSRREKLFDNLDILPDFELKTLRAVQSNAGSEVPYNNWFEALKWMEDEMAKIDFDICVIGCGAYGLPLAATAKRMGKKAVHMGGGLQLLFGIKGKRWDNNGYHWSNLPQLDTNYSRLYNDYWVRPSQSETPRAAQNVEGACYW